MLKRMTIKKKLIVGGVFAVSIPLAITGIIIYVQLSRSLLDITKHKAMQLAQEISDTIDSLISQEVQLALSIAADPDLVESSKEGDYRGTQAKLEAIYHRLAKPHFTIFILDNQGIARAEPRFPQNINLDLSYRDYFKNAREGRTTIAGPLLSSGRTPGNDLIVIISTPILDNDQFLGAVVLAFKTDLVNRLLAYKKTGRTGYAFLMSEDGLILIHPDETRILKDHLLDQPGTDNIKRLLASQVAGVAECRIDGVEKVIGLARSSQTKWVAAFVQNRREILSPVRKILYFIGIGAAVFLALTILIIVFLSSRISSPIDRSLEMIKQMTRHSNEIIIQAGPDGRIVFVNPAFEKITGLKSENIMGLGLDINTSFPFSKRNIWESLQKGSTWSGRITINEADSRDITLDVTILPLSNDRGVIQGYLEIGRDVTAEIMFEKRLQQAQKMEALGTLAGGIAHDFNNILSGIFGFSELIMIDKDTPEKIEGYLREIIIASERARDLVSQILTFSRKPDVDLMPLRPKSVLKEVQKLLRATVPAHIDIQTKIESNGVIMADPTHIHRIIMNLAANGIHAIGADQGVIKLELEDFVVDEAFTQTHPNISTGKHVLLRVADSGCGMDPETLEHVFEPFFTTKSRGKGTGLGLSVVHGIVSQIKGIITVYSDPGHGSTFNVILPCIQVEESELIQPDTFIREGTERILIVDDERAIITSMKTILTSLGYRVTAFYDSREALAALLDHPEQFDVLLTDYSMPHLNGLDIVRSLQGANIDLPVILSSGFLSNKIEIEARELGVTVLVSKPVTTYRLTQAIQHALDTKSEPPRSLDSNQD